jgi:hypothetical protein
MNTRGKATAAETRDAEAFDRWKRSMSSCIEGRIGISTDQIADARLCEDLYADGYTPSAAAMVAIREAEDTLCTW